MMRNKTRIIIIIALALVIVIAGVVLLLLPGESKPEHNEDDLLQEDDRNNELPTVSEQPPEENDLPDESEQPPEGNELQSDETGHLSAFDIVSNMRVGWNLGNALDSLDNQGRGIRESLPEGVTPEEFYETLWRNPVTTREMIDTVVDKGFGAIRIPVTYNDHMDENFQIRRDWLLRVEQVVNYVLDAGAYCIINIHHDTGSGTWPWLRADPENIEQLSEQLSTVWTQIAEHFRDYDERLIFESFNEILDVDSLWYNSSIAAYFAVNQLNQVFVDTVRATGGNNANRFLVVKTYAASARHEDILNAFLLPRDSAADHLIVGVHLYAPHAFTRTQEAAPWLETHPDWDKIRDGGAVEDIMGLLNRTFVQHGIPVIIGEFGAMNKNNTADRANFAGHFVEIAKRYGITCFWWDDGGPFENVESVTNYALFDRYRVQWFFPEIAEALVAAASTPFH